MAGADTMPAAADDAPARADGHPSSPPRITSDSLAPDTSAVTGKDATDGSTPDPTAAAEAIPAVKNSDAAVVAGQEAAGDESAGQTATAGSLGDAAGAQPAAVDTASAQAAANPELATEQQPLSKNQQKKLRKMQRRQEVKVQRKAEEKAQKAAALETRRAEAQARSASMTEEERAAHKAVMTARLTARRQEAAEKKERQNKALTQGQRLVVDLDFEGLMTAAEVSSICNQLMHAYSANSRAAVPCHLHFTSVKGAIQQQLQRQLSGFENWKVTRSEDPYIELFAEEQQRLVYLTADAETELEVLNPQDVYIIGGLVDRNRHKNICLERAQQQGIRTARLPISGRVQLTSSTVLTVNQVVEIMLVYLETSDWAAALEKVIPSRKRGGTGNEAKVEAGGEAKRAKTT